MQTSKWGAPGWHFLHCLPMCYSSTLNTAQLATLEEFLVLLKDILPCKYCRASYADFVEEVPPGEYIREPPSEFGYPQSSRLAVARWLFDIHNKVNKKLEKPIEIDFIGTCCRLQQRNGEAARKAWCDAMWDFLFTVAWNYIAEDWRETAVRRFFALLPEIIAACPIGQQLTNCLSNSPLDSAALESREKFKVWIYNLRSGCTEVCGPPPTFDSIDRKFESWRSGKCNDSQPVERKSTPSLETC